MAARGGGGRCGDLDAEVGAPGGGAEERQGGRRFSWRRGARNLAEGLESSGAGARNRQPGGASAAADHEGGGGGSWRRRGAAAALEALEIAGGGGLTRRRWRRDATRQLPGSSARVTTQESDLNGNQDARKRNDANFRNNEKHREQQLT